MGFGERNTYDGDCAEHCHGEMEDSYLPPSGEYPDYVETDLKAAGIRHHFDIPSERTEGKACQFEKLDAERYAHYRDAHKKSEE